MSTRTDPASAHVAQARRAVRARGQNLSAQLAVTIALIYLANALFTLTLKALVSGPRAILQPQNLAEAFLATQSSFLRTQLPLTLIAIAAIQFFLVVHAVVTWRRRRRADQRHSQALSQSRARDARTRADVTTEFFRDIDSAVETMRGFAHQQPSFPTTDVQEQVAVYRRQLDEVISGLNQQADAALLPRINELAEADRIFKAVEQGAMSPGEAVDELVNLKFILSPLLQEVYQEYEFIRTQDDRIKQIRAWFGEDHELLGYVQDEINARQRLRRYFLPVLLPAAAVVAARLIGLLTSH